MSAVAPNPFTPGAISASRGPIAVVGLGHVGLPMAAWFADSGRRVLGFDRDAVRLAEIGRGRMPLAHLAGRDVPGSFEPTADLERLAECSEILLCLPTSLEPDRREPDLSALFQWRDRLAALPDAPPRLLLVTSTVPPGTTRKLFEEPLWRRYDVVFSPEREDPGSNRSPRSVPRVIGAESSAGLERAAKLFESAGIPVHRAPSLEVAEASKLWENLYRSVNIALAAELERLLLDQGIDPGAVLEAASTKPFGFAPFHAGPGAGGPCIPEVARFLSKLGGSDLLEAVDRVHQSAPARLLERLDAALVERSIRPESARVLVVGVGYKPGVADTRNAPGAALVERLAERGNQVEYLDPLVRALELPALGGRRAAPFGALNAGIESAEAEIARFDAVVLVNPPEEHLLGAFARASRLILDPRGLLKGVHRSPGEAHDNGPSQG